MLCFASSFRIKAIWSRPNYPMTQLPSVKIRRQRGYILLVLLLFVALLSIGSLAIIRSLEFQIKRDREEEMIHRGVQYSRAIKHFYKKFGRYPTRVEELESSNNLRFLRKRYKDPLNRDKATGKEKDFKFLHLQDVQMSFGAAQRGLTSVTDMANQQGGSPGALNPAAAAPTGAGPGAIGGQSQPVQQAPGQERADQSDTSNQDQQVSGEAGGTPPPPQPLSQQAGPNGAPQVFGGGAIVGVASLNKDKTIREFNKKNHYNQWQFIYDPSTDRGGLLSTPNQPPLQGAAQNVQQNGQPGTLNQNQNPGFGSSFGNGTNQNPQQPTPEPPTQQ